MKRLMALTFMLACSGSPTEVNLDQPPDSIPDPGPDTTAHEPDPDTTSVPVPDPDSAGTDTVPTPSAWVVTVSNGPVSDYDEYNYCSHESVYIPVFSHLAVDSIGPAEERHWVYRAGDGQGVVREYRDSSVFHGVQARDKSWGRAVNEVHLTTAGAGLSYHTFHADSIHADGQLETLSSTEECR